MAKKEYEVPSKTYLTGALQVKAYRILQHYASIEIKKHNINPTQWFILGQINEAPESRPADIAQLLRVEAPLITALTDDLNSKGLIHKKSSKNDRRVKLLVLTPKAKKLIPKVENDLVACLEELFEGLSEYELAVYEKVLGTIVQNG